MDEKAQFLTHCETWVCDGYSSDIRYIATRAGSGYALFDAVVLLNPLPHSDDNRLLVESNPILAGQEQVAKVAKSELLAIVEKALLGTLVANGREMSLPRDGAYRIQLASMAANTWFQPLTCQIIGASASTLIADRAALDAGLRASNPPFDGSDDLQNWLALRMPSSAFLSTVKISIGPPVDLLTDRSRFIGDRLHMVFSAHHAVDVSQIRIAIRAVPTKGLQSRGQIADQVQWREIESGLLEGTADIDLPDATAALVMLLIGSETVRRQWFLHPTKAPNYRYAAVQQFDPELRMIRRALFEDGDSKRFEAAVAALLCVLGFAAAVQLETNSPDIIVATPAGRIVVVECTTRVADIASKVGKLVDRRGSLQKELRAGNKAVDVTAALVCRLPRDQIAVDTRGLGAQGIILATGDDLTNWLARGNLSADADQILTQALGDVAAASPTPAQA